MKNQNEIQNWLEWLCFIILFFMMIYVLGSCTAPPTRGEYFQENKEIPIKYVWRIKTGFVDIGMNDKMILASWGEPDTIQISGNCKRWGYYLKNDTTWVEMNYDLLISVTY